MTRNKTMRVVQYGFGHIGREVVRLLLSKPQFRLVGVIDNDPLKAGCKLDDFLDDGARSSLRISNDAEACLRKTKPDAVIHTTGSSIIGTLPQIEQIVRAGAHCVSSTEELLYPQLRNPDTARRLDRLARENGVAVLGTGVNPGFVMDLLPLCLTGVCQRVRSVRVTRVLDASKRRLPLQKKIGAGLTTGEFRLLARSGRLGHVGLLESLMLLARGLGWKLNRWKETIQPKIAPRRLQTRFLAVPKGRVAGLHQVATGYRRGKAVLTLDLSMFIGAEESLDLVEIDGTPAIRTKVIGGVHGDLATVGSLVNAVPRVIESRKSGLLTVIDLAVPRTTEG